MKKNISININGIVFHIEEDGYENLLQYLSAINKYFSSFIDSAEIIAGIEKRIAEILFTKISHGKQVITNDDINTLIGIMGGISDFKYDDLKYDNEKSQHYSNSGSDPNAYNKTSSNKEGSPKKLLRDQKHKILGGVCSGLGSYINIDAVWIRLLFVLLTFAFGIILIIYIVMWIVVPGSYELDEPGAAKKMYRDVDNKVIGGVAGGVALFLNIDVVIVRVLFIVLTVVGGFGLIIYIALWFILPQARTLTDKMRMRGESITLSNIRSSFNRKSNS